MTNSVRCMLLPLSSASLVIPSTAVAEILAYTTLTRLPDSSEWLLGAVLWRGVYVPVISVEEMCALDTIHLGARDRIAIVYNPQKEAELPYIGLHLQDIPRAYLANDNNMETGSSDGLNQYLLSTVDDKKHTRFIPDLDAMIASLVLEYSQEKLDRITKHY